MSSTMAGPEFALDSLATDMERVLATVFIAHRQGAADPRNPVCYLRHQHYYRRREYLYLSFLILRMKDVEGGTSGKVFTNL